VTAKRINWTADEVTLVAAEVMQNGWRGFDERSESAARLSDVLRRAPFHPVADRGDKFRNPNGVARKSYDIATRHPSYTGVQTNGSRIDGEVLQEFLADPEGMLTIAEALEAAIVNERPSDYIAMTEEDEGEDEASAPEGRLVLALHRRYERDPRLRERKLNSVRKAGLPIACEACRFDFEATYGERGRGYIEVHHVTPLHSSGATITTLDDLALLCSNCHRMIHRSRPWINPSQLRFILSQARHDAGTRHR
jgi:5-methylcytosine-specific restriction protein A